MNNLTANELKIMNFTTMELDNSVQLGTKLQEVIDAVEDPIIAEGTPRNATAATATLGISGVVIHGEIVNIGDDVYEFAADEANAVQDGNIPVDISGDTVASSGVLTLAAQPTAGDTMTIGEKVYIFVPVGTDTADGEVSIGADLAIAKTNLVAAINGTDGISEPHPLVSASAFAVNDCTITALVGGAAGDLIATTETFTSGLNIFAAITLGSGVDCTAAKAVTALVAAITADDTQGVSATDGTGDTVVLTAEVGASGNDVSVSTTMANASFGDAATELSGGLNGTVSSGVQFMANGTDTYVCLAANTITGTNWRKVTIGAL